MSARQLLRVGALDAYLLFLGFLGGMLASAIRFGGQRAAILSRLDRASTRVRAHLMRLEHDAVRSVEPRDQLTRSASLHPSGAVRAR